jgi:hypothetical protein
MWSATRFHFHFVVVLYFSFPQKKTAGSVAAENHNKQRKEAEG